MELSRRDAVAALAAVGVGGAGAAMYAWRRDDAPEPTPDVETLAAVAAVVYPSEVEGTEAFVETYAAERASGDDDHANGVRAATERIDSKARDWYEAPFADLSLEDRDSLLREMGVDMADEDPQGTTAERVRYFVVGDLLLALYASPTGGELVGIENLLGHPGGLESYRRGP